MEDAESLKKQSKWSTLESSSEEEEEGGAEEESFMNDEDKGDKEASRSDERPLSSLERLAIKQEAENQNKAAFRPRGNFRIHQDDPEQAGGRVRESRPASNRNAGAWSNPSKRVSNDARNLSLKDNRRSQQTVQPPQPPPPAETRSDGAKVISKAALMEKMASASSKDKKSAKGKGSSSGGSGGKGYNGGSKTPTPSKGNSSDHTPGKFKGGHSKMKPLEAPKMGLLAQHEARMAAKAAAQAKKQNSNSSSHGNNDDKSHVPAKSTPSRGGFVITTDLEENDDAGNADKGVNIEELSPASRIKQAITSAESSPDKPSDGPTEMMLVPVPKEKSSVYNTSSAQTHEKKLPGKMVLTVDNGDDDNGAGDGNDQSNALSDYNSANQKVPPRYSSNATNHRTHNKPRSRGNSFDRSGRGAIGRSRSSSYDQVNNNNNNNNNSDSTRSVPIDKKVYNPKPVTQLSPNSMEKAIASTTFELHIGNSPNAKEGKTNSSGSSGNSNHDHPPRHSKKHPPRHPQPPPSQHQIVQPYDVGQKASPMSPSATSAKGGSVGSVFTNLKSNDKKKSIYKISIDS